MRDFPSLDNRVEPPGDSFAHRALDCQVVTACIESYHVGMRKKAPSRRYTIRGIPEEVDRVLRQKAARQKRSLKQVVVEEIDGSDFRRQA